jgi:hypothetical protein
MELGVGMLAYGFVRPLDLTGVGVDAHDSPLRMSMQQQRGEHAVSAAHVEHVGAGRLRRDCLQRRQLEPRAAKPPFFRG